MTDIQMVDAPIVPAHLVVASGLGSGFESLSRPFREEVLRLRGVDLGVRIAELEKQLGEERAALVALSELLDYLDEPDAERTIYKTLEKN